MKALAMTIEPISHSLACVAVANFGRTDGRRLLILAVAAMGLQISGCAEPPEQASRGSAERTEAVSATPPKPEASWEPEGHWCSMRTRVCK